MASVGAPAGSAVPGVTVAASGGDAVGDVLSGHKGRDRTHNWWHRYGGQGEGMVAVMALRHRSGLAPALSGRAPIPVATHRQE